MKKKIVIAVVVIALCLAGYLVIKSNAKKAVKAPEVEVAAVIEAAKPATEAVK
jgi:hypothetical protein